MSETNAPVISEGKIESGGAVTWDDLETVDVPKAKAKPSAEKPEPKKPSAKQADDEGGDDKAQKPRADKKEAVKADAEEGDGEGKGAKKEPQAKPKVHKARSGESQVDVAGDSLFTVQIDGKKEEVQLQDLLDNYSGKVHYDRKFTDLDKQQKAHKKTVESMNSMVNNLLSKAKENPASGLDFLADLTGQDPVEFKEKTLRAQIAELLPLAQMAEDERELAIKDMVRDWRDQRYAQRDKDDKEKAAEAKKAAEITAARERYGIDEERYGEAERFVRDYLEKAGGEKDYTPRDVIYAERYLFALDVVKETLPSLASHEKFDKIMEDIAAELLSSPSLGSKERLAQVLVEVYGTDDDKAGLKKLARKAQQQAEASGDELPEPKKPQGKREAMFFDDL